MNQLIATLSRQEMSMTSLEIANETGKQHKNVLADIRKMFEQLGMDPESMLELDESQGRHKARNIYRLDEHHTWVLITRYSTLLRSAVIRRWKDMETHFKLEREKSIEIAPSENYNLACLVLEREGSMADEWFEDKLESYLRKNGLMVSKVPEAVRPAPARRKRICK